MIVSFRMKRLLLCENNMVCGVFELKERDSSVVTVTLSGDGEHCCVISTAYRQNSFKMMNYINTESYYLTRFVPSLYAACVNELINFRNTYASSEYFSCRFSDGSTNLHQFKRENLATVWTTDCAKKLDSKLERPDWQIMFSERGDSIIAWSQCLRKVLYQYHVMIPLEDVTEMISDTFGNSLGKLKLVKTRKVYDIDALPENIFHLIRRLTQKETVSVGVRRLTQKETVSVGVHTHKSIGAKNAHLAKEQFLESGSEHLLLINNPNFYPSSRKLIVAEQCGKDFFLIRIHSSISSESDITNNAYYFESNASNQFLNLLMECSDSSSFERILEVEVWINGAEAVKNFESVDQNDESVLISLRGDFFALHSSNGTMKLLHRSYLNTTYDPQRNPSLSVDQQRSPQPQPSSLSVDRPDSSWIVKYAKSVNKLLQYRDYLVRRFKNCQIFLRNRLTLERSLSSWPKSMIPHVLRKEAMTTMDADGGAVHLTAWILSRNYNATVQLPFVLEATPSRYEVVVRSRHQDHSMLSFHSHLQTFEFIPSETNHLGNLAIVCYSLSDWLNRCNIFATTSSRSIQDLSRKTELLISFFKWMVQSNSGLRGAEWQGLHRINGDAKDDSEDVDLQSKVNEALLNNRRYLIAHSMRTSNLSEDCNLINETADSQLRLAPSTQTMVTGALRDSFHTIQRNRNAFRNLK